MLRGGPADGMRVRVADRPRVLQVSFPGEPDPGAPATGMRVEAVHVYRRERGDGGEPVTYGFDGVSP